MPGPISSIGTAFGRNTFKLGALVVVTILICQIALGQPAKISCGPPLPLYQWTITASVDKTGAISYVCQYKNGSSAGSQTCYTDDQPLYVCAGDTVQWQAEAYEITVVIPNKEDHNLALFQDSKNTPRWRYMGAEAVPQTAKDATVSNTADTTRYEYTLTLKDPITGSTYKDDPGMKAGGQMQKQICAELICHTENKKVYDECVQGIKHLLGSLGLPTLTE
jgi:hypothetical protein